MITQVDNGVLPKHELTQPAPNGRPFVVHDREAHGITCRMIGRDPVSSKNAFAFPTDALDRRHRALVTHVCVQADAECAPLFERVRQHEELDLGVDYRSDCRSSQPGIANLAGIDEITTTARMSLGPCPSFQIPEACGAYDGVVGQPHDRERHCSTGRSRSYSGVDVFGDFAHALRHRTPCVERRIGGRCGHKAVCMAVIQWFEARMRSGQHEIMRFHSLGLLSRVSSAIKLVSQVFPPSSENACSNLCESRVMSDQMPRTRMVLSLKVS